MNFPFSTPPPYIHAAMSQAVHALMNGGPLPPNCLIMSVPFHQMHQGLPQIMMNPAITGADPLNYPKQAPYYSPSPYMNPSQPSALTASKPHALAAPPPSHHPLAAPPQHYNYPVVPYKTNHKSKPKNRQQPHGNIYNSSSFDSYMHNLSWSRLFDHPRSQKKSKRRSQNGTPNDHEKKSDSSKKQRSNSSSSSGSSTTSSTTSDETIRRVTVTNKPAINNNNKQQTKGSLPFKYSSEFIPGLGKQQSPQVKTTDVFVIRKP